MEKNMKPTREMKEFAFTSFCTKIDELSARYTQYQVEPTYDTWNSLCFDLVAFDLMVIDGYMNDLFTVKKRDHLLKLRHCLPLPPGPDEVAPVGPEAIWTEEELTFFTEKGC